MRRKHNFRQCQVCQHKDFSGLTVIIEKLAINCAVYHLHNAQRNSEHVKRKSELLSEHYLLLHKCIVHCECYDVMILIKTTWLYLQGCNQKFPDWIDNEIYSYNNEHSLRSNTKGYSGKTYYTGSQNSYTTRSSGRELYHLQFSLQAASPVTFGYTLVCSTMASARRDTT